MNFRNTDVFACAKDTTTSESNAAGKEGKINKKKREELENGVLQLHLPGQLPGAEILSDVKNNNLKK